MPFSNLNAAMKRRLRIYDATDIYNLKFLFFAEGYDEAERLTGVKASTIKAARGKQYINKKNDLNIPLFFK